MNRMPLPPLVHAARDLAQVLLTPLPQRWRHTISVARRAEDLIITLGDDDPAVLLAAAWLHDIGYAPDLVDTGFHPLDGARHLDRSGWPSRIAALVAHHSGAIYVADVRGVADDLDRYPREESPLADALTYADQTVGPTGQRVTTDQRIAEVLHRHGPRSPQAAAHTLREPFLLAVAHRTQQRLIAVAADPRSKCH